jgi:Domain of unknown function (DUF4145)
MSQPFIQKYERPNIFQVDEVSGSGPVSTVSIRCPHCRQLGTFMSPVPGLNYHKRMVQEPTNTVVTSPHSAAVYICPNTECKGLVFAIRNAADLLKVVPPELLEFQAENIPAKLLTTLTEAVACHAAGANRAAAMMVRRLLEEVCDDNNASGRDLHQRIEAIKSSVTLPNDLFSAMFELKALGNDAAHIEAKAYDNIGPDEAEDSIELAKEILKSLYQLKGLVSRLQARRKP